MNNTLRHKFRPFQHISRVIELGVKESNIPSEDVDINPMVSICKNIYAITGLMVNDYTLEKTSDDTVIHTWVFPLNMDYHRSLTLNLKTLTDTIDESINSQFDYVDTEIKGIGLSIYVKATILI